MRPRILFIDDEPEVLDGLRWMLHDQRSVWDMTFISSAAEAIGRLNATASDAIVVDLLMPGLSGFDLIERLRPADRDSPLSVPVVVLTGASDRSLKRRALDLGATDLLTKPVDADELRSRLHSMLRVKAYEDRIRHYNQTLEQRIQDCQRELAAARPRR